MCDPRGCTKLFDTAIQCVNSLEERASEWYAAQSPALRRLVSFDQVVTTFILFTDGADNRSFLDPNGSILFEAIRDFRSAGGTAIFMAANQDACSVGVKLGFNTDTSLSVGSTPEYASVAFQGITQMVREISSGSQRVSVPRSLRQSSCANPSPTEPTISQLLNNNSPSPPSQVNFPDPIRLRRGLRGRTRRPIDQVNSPVEPTNRERMYMATTGINSFTRHR